MSKKNIKFLLFVFATKNMTCKQYFLIGEQNRTFNPFSEHSINIANKLQILKIIHFLGTTPS
jgi:hypothetical protein